MKSQKVVCHISSLQCVCMTGVTPWKTIIVPTYELIKKSCTSLSVIIEQLLLAAIWITVAKKAYEKLQMYLTLRT